MFWNTHSVLRDGWKQETISKWMNNMTIRVMIEDAIQKASGLSLKPFVLVAGTGFALVS